MSPPAASDAQCRGAQDGGGELCGGAESLSLPWLLSCRAPVQAHSKVGHRSSGPAGAGARHSGVVAAVQGTAGFIDGFQRT